MMTDERTRRKFRIVISHKQMVASKDTRELDHLLNHSDDDDFEFTTYREEPTYRQVYVGDFPYASMTGMLVENLLAKMAHE